ncbi:MAG: lamin tail domain-containing protein, partial [Bacteroidia bacterium]|nr:lamin tail domain-containing protein [Bacteroidia bacterium]
MVTSAYAQVTDNFSDGDFTANPAWTGDGAEFIVNASQQLQLNNTLAGASYLSFPNALASLDNTEWHFYISQTFAPSSSNYGRVYLVSDQANLEGSLNGYYLQFGEAGTTDAVELFRQTGLTSTSVCRGTNAQIAASFAIGIKVTRDASGNWSLFVDPAGGTAYVLQANGTDNTYTSSSFFGVATVYTVSNATKFFFDNFYIGPVIVDNTAPSIVSTTVISSTQLDVLFDEAVDLTTVQTAGNYSVNNGIGNPASAVRDASNFALVHLTFATAFSNALLNTLTVSNVQDQSANAITTATSNFTYFAPVTAAYKDVIITEIYADPSPQVALPATEFVELFNRSSNTLNLNGWKFTDGSSTATLGNYNLAPNQYLIICPIADTASYSVFGAVMGVSSFPSLNNT